MSPTEPPTPEGEGDPAEGEEERMFSPPQISLLPLARQPLPLVGGGPPPLFPSSPSSGHREEDDPYHPDPLPPSPVQAVADGLAFSHHQQSRGDETTMPPTEPAPFAAAAPRSATTTALPLSSSSVRALTPLDPNPNPNAVTDNGSCGGAADADAEAEDDKKREREHKKRSKNWTRPETLKLIRLRTQLEPRFAKSGRKTELWDEIAESLQRERITRDAQQCRDKWEKLTAGYKEVRDGVKDREDNAFYDELHPLLSGKSLKRERERERDRDKDIQGKESSKDLSQDLGAADGFTRGTADKEALHRGGGGGARSREAYKDEDDDLGEETGARASSRKKKRGPKYITVTDLAAVQSLLEAVINRQQRFFRDLLDSMERKEQLREQIRQEKEDKWRAEERAQRGIFNNAMIVLTQKLVGDRVGSAVLGSVGPLVGSPEGPQGPKRRSKNWKRAEVLQLIKLRGEMDGRFAKSTRRASLWEELAELLAAQGINRDGKQCREKWDKLMAEYKDVTDGKRDQNESPYFAELTAIVGRPA